MSEAPGLTIGRLAAYAGVTVRAVRHYHERGLLAEPGRDASGYRRYDADAAVRLLRITALAEAGVPLGRVAALLDAPPPEVREAVAAIDADLDERIAELRRRRERLSRLADGEDALLPDELRALLEELRRIGVRPAVVRHERDAWVLLLASSREMALTGLRTKLDLVRSDAAVARVYRAWDRVLDLDPDDPELEAVADELAAATHRRDDPDMRAWQAWVRENPDAVSMLEDYTAAHATPASLRLAEIAEERGLQERRPTFDHPADRRRGHDDGSPAAPRR